MLFRNGIMLSVACGLAESRGLLHVMMANHGGDHAIYPDCRPDFVEAMSEAMRCGTYDGVTIEAAFTNITKGDIAALGKRLGVDYSLTYSCYKGVRSIAENVALAWSAAKLWLRPESTTPQYMKTDYVLR